VSVPCTSLFKTVTVRCGHCTNLLSVNMRALLLPAPNQLHLGHTYFNPQTLMVCVCARACMIFIQAIVYLSFQSLNLGPLLKTISVHQENYRYIYMMLCLNICILIMDYLALQFLNQFIKLSRFSHRVMSIYKKFVVVLYFGN